MAPAGSFPPFGARRPNLGQKAKGPATKRLPTRFNPLSSLVEMRGLELLTSCRRSYPFWQDLQDSHLRPNLTEVYRLPI